MYFFLFIKLYFNFLEHSRKIKKILMKKFFSDSLFFNDFCQKSFLKYGKKFQKSEIGHNIFFPFS